MSKNHEVTRKQPLLTENGTIGEPGWARCPVYDYNRENIRACRLRRKEWDYYLITNENFAFAVTVSDLGYLGMLSVSLLDFKSRKETTKTALDLKTGRDYGLGKGPEDYCTNAQSGKIRIRYQKKNGYRRIQCICRDFLQGNDLHADILLTEPEMDSMVIATPWKKEPTAFYYNQKINTMPAAGQIRCGELLVRFDPAVDFGMLDLGRGVWTYDNIWYWGTGSRLVNGKPLGMNLGYGFSDRSYATENMFIYDGHANKLDEVTIDIPKDNGKFEYMLPWNIFSPDGRLSAVFTPFMDRSASIDFKIFASIQHQVFGKMNGTVILDDGTSLLLKDYPCSVEHVHNRY